MTTQLPRRPFGAVPPPPDGLAQVRHEARRRRRRRATTVAAGGAGIAAVAAVVALSSAGAGFAVLQPDRPAGGSLTVGPTPTSTPVPTAEHHAHRLQPGAGGSPSGRSSHPTSLGPGTVAGTTDGNAAATGSARAGSTARPRTSSEPAEPRLTRYRSTYPKASVDKGARLCGENFGYGPGAGGGVGWCFNSTAHAVAGGVRLAVQVCRDDTSGGTLDYGSAREVDIAVQRAGKTVWDWGRDHPDQAGAHQLSVPTDGCWNWSLVWSGNTRAGGVAPHGTYTFVATTTASELSGYPPRTAQFTY